MYNSGNSSKNVRGSDIIDGTVETVDIADDAVTVDKLANAINTDIATGVAALPKAGGAMTGPITTNSTFDGRDVAADGATLDLLPPRMGNSIYKSGAWHNKTTVTLSFAGLANATGSSWRNWAFQVNTASVDGGLSGNTYPTFTVRSYCLSTYSGINQDALSVQAAPTVTLVSSTSNTAVFSFPVSDTGTLNVVAYGYQVSAGNTTLTITAA